MKLLIPSYFAPDHPDWDKVVAGLGEDCGECIINPDSGPGFDLDRAYLDLCVRLRKAGIGILGYVYTHYGERNGGEVMSDIKDYSDRYGINNIFLDEASSEPGDVKFYTDLYELIQGKVVLNHGTAPDKKYLDAGDVLVIFEGYYQAHRTAKFPEWVSMCPKSRFAQIVYGATSIADMDASLARIRKTSGYCYVTDDFGDNPYDRLPSYFAKELKAA
jgi:Spherulation-specific family 4.